MPAQVRSNSSESPIVEFAFVDGGVELPALFGGLFLRHAVRLPVLLMSSLALKFFSGNRWSCQDKPCRNYGSENEHRADCLIMADRWCAVMQKFDIER